jgi:hypothetical protein
MEFTFDTASVVSDQYTPEGSRFTGTVEWGQIDIDHAAEDLDHLISPEFYGANISAARPRASRLGRSTSATMNCGSADAPLWKRWTSPSHWRRSTPRIGPA